MNIKTTIKRIPFHIFKWNTKRFVKLHEKEFQKKVAIISTDQYLGKLKDDVYLKCMFSRSKVKTDIVSWQDKNVDFNEYDALIIRSIWGFHHHLEEFEKWLTTIKNNHILLLNPVDMIKDNLDKEKQFQLLDQYQIKHIETTFTESKNIKEVLIKQKDASIVVKPTISESGNDTYLLGEENKKNNKTIEEIESLLQNVTSKIMVQPFIKEIENGEYSLVFIDGKFQNAVLRYPSIFTNKNTITHLEQVDPKLYALALQITNIKEYQQSLYMRIDAVKLDDEYQIMEIELTDPDLFFSFIPNHKKRKQTFQFFVDSVLKRIDKK